MIRITGLGQQAHTDGRKDHLYFSATKWTSMGVGARALTGNHVLTRGGECLDVPNFSPMADSKKLTTAAGIPGVDNQNVITARRRGPNDYKKIGFLKDRSLCQRSDPRETHACQRIGCFWPLYGYARHHALVPSKNIFRNR